jgi:hypothetical protein
VNWNRLKERAEQHNKCYIWLFQRVSGYFSLVSTEHNVKPYTDGCWYMGEINHETTREEFTQKYPSILTDAFIDTIAA